jgi:hypothetical protein
VRAGATRDDVAAAARPALAPAGLEWQADLIHHTDLETDGGYRTPGDQAEPLPEGSVATLRLELELPGGSRAVLADTLVMEGGTGRCLTDGLPGPVITTDAA